MNTNEILLSRRNTDDDTTTTTTTTSSSRRISHYIPKDLFSCLICYETFGVDQEKLVALKCGHMFCATCIQQWFTTNKVCPTCRKRCWLKDILSIDISNCIVAYGKKKIENLSVERDRLKTDIQLLKSSIFDFEKHLQRTEHDLKMKQRFLHRLRYMIRRKHR